MIINGRLRFSRIDKIDKKNGTHRVFPDPVELSKSVEFEKNSKKSLCHRSSQKSVILPFLGVKI